MKRILPWCLMMSALLFVTASPAEAAKPEWPVNGGGVVNCQTFIGDWERFRLIPQPGGAVAIASVEFPGVYLRMDGRGAGRRGGGGVVNCQTSIGALERFQLIRLPGGAVAIASVQFPGFYLRMDGR